MSRSLSERAINTGNQDLGFPTDLPNRSNSALTNLAEWIRDRNIPFLTTSIGMIVMLLWAERAKQ